MENTDNVENQINTWERLSLDTGQLSYQKNITPEIIEFLKINQPWDKSGKDLGSKGRRVEQFDLPNGTKLVLKESRYSGKEMSLNHSLTNTSSPSSQNSLISSACRKYFEQYGQELPVERPLAYFIDKDTTKRYTFYPYYKSANEGFEVWDDEYQHNSAIASKKAKEIAIKIQKLGFYLGESAEGGGNFVIVKDNSPEGVGVVFVDTEYWKIKSGDN